MIPSAQWVARGSARRTESTHHHDHGDDCVGSGNRHYAIFGPALCRDLAPHSCERLTEMPPCHGTVIHARWSGEALWSSLAAVWPAGLHLPHEHAICEPKAGDVLLYAGHLSELEFLIPYGTAGFSSKAGLLKGNPVADDRRSALGSPRTGSLRSVEGSNAISD